MVNFHKLGLKQNRLIDSSTIPLKVTLTLSTKKVLLTSISFSLRASVESVCGRRSSHRGSEALESINFREAIRNELSQKSFTRMNNEDSFIKMKICQRSRQNSERHQKK